MLAAKLFDTDVTNHLLLDCVILFAKKEEHIVLVRKWYLSGKVTNLAGEEIVGLQISTKHKHSMVRRIFSSRLISREEKQ
jgi:hypothetical protein